MAILIPGLPGPRCGHPVQRHGWLSDPDPVCARPDGHERGGTPASLRHLSTYAYRNELRRNRVNGSRYRR